MEELWHVFACMTYRNFIQNSKNLRNVKELTYVYTIQTYQINTNKHKGRKNEHTHSVLYTSYV